MTNKATLTKWMTILSIVLLFVMTTSCKTNAPAQREVAPDPFTVVWGAGKDHVVTFSGDSAGHVAGEISEFTLNLDNNSLELWHGEYIVQLLDSEGIVMEIGSDTFEVRSGMKTEIDIKAEFHAGLEGPYGLSLYIPTREAQSIQTIWIGEKSFTEVEQWPSITSHPWLWPESSSFTEESAQQMAEEFIRNSPTFTFDGIAGSILLLETLYPDIENAWQFVFEFGSFHAGYGNREGQMLAEVITSHKALVTVENGEIKSAIIDSEWDMLEQAKLADSAS